MNYKSFTDLSIDITRNLHKIHSGNYDLVVGIPRSGMIPAYMIGLYLNIHVTSLDALIDNKRLVSGITRSPRNKLNFAIDAKRVLLVDDSIDTGQSMLSVLDLIPEATKKKVTTCAIYSSLKSREDIDFYLEYIEMPRVFEWNIFHRDLMSRSCLDIDGVLCIDPSENENDDGEKYKNFILNAKPLHIPSTTVKALVTSRLEKYRPQTEQWLQNHNIQYDQLIMLDLPSKEERQRLGVHASHKSSYYINSGLDFFVESEPLQAISIMKNSGKPVFCTGNNQMYAPRFNQVLIKSPKTLLKKMKCSVAIILPSPLKKIIKPTYNILFNKNSE